MPLRLLDPVGDSGLFPDHWATLLFAMHMSERL